MYERKINRFITLLVASFIGVFMLFPSTVSAGAPSINFCSGGKSTPQTIRLVFTILSVLGPVFGTLFFVGMSVADSATTKQKYKGQRRRVLLLGFGVPVSIAFLETIGNKLTQGTDITCFFP